MAMLPTPLTFRPTTYQLPTTTPVVTVRPSPTSGKTRRRVSEAEYWEKYYIDLNDHQYEWNNGSLEEKPMPDHVSCLMYDWFKILLIEYLQNQPVAKMVSLEMAFRLALPHQVAIRKPDLGVVLNSNPVPLGPRDQSYHGIFDICLESLSYSKPSEIKRDTVSKKREYAQAGVKEYYILDARDEAVETAFYQLTPGGIYVPIQPTSDGLIGANVLPGFQFRLADLQRRPTLGKLSEDPVYQAFVGLDRQAERQARQLAESQAHAEREARQVAEAQTHAEREARCHEAEARQLAESKLQQLQAELARLRQSQ
jgi:Uma2 family endonuclease